MKRNLPSLSIIIPTYNSGETLILCLKSIREQDYPKERIETIIIDAKSSDDTLKTAKNFRVTKILNNPLVTAEAGKSLGVKAAKNEIIALIDSDNILEERDWLKRMVEPFEDPEIVAAEPLYYTYRKGDPLVVRYSALIGANDPICMYIGNYDRYNYVTDKWTELSVKSQDKGDYLKITLNRENVPTIGANGFLVRKSMLKKTGYQPYFFDIDVVCELVEKGKDKFAKVKIGIIHLFAKDTRAFIKKQRRRIQDYLYFKKEKMRRYPWGRIHSKKIRRFVILTFLIFPLLFDTLRGYRRIRDRAWFFHIPACWLTLLIYGSARIKDRWFKKKLKIREEGLGKKRVLIISPFFRPNVGGVETHLDDLCEYLRTHDHYVYVLTYQPITTKARGERIERRENLEVHRFPWIGYNLFYKLGPRLTINFLYLVSGLFFRTFFFLLRNRRRIDAIHAQGLSSSFIAKFMKKFFGKKTVMSTQAIYKFKKGSLFARVTRWTLSSLDKIIAESEESKEELTNIGVSQDKIAIFSHWVDQERFRPRDKKRCKEKLGWQNKFVVLFVGRLIPIKGAATLLEVAKQVDRRINFAFIGDAGPQIDLVRERAKELPNVIFLGGIDYQNLATYYNAADVFIIPSQYEEGVARVMLEALSCGTPVIGSRRGSIPSVLDSSVALLVEPEVKEMKKAIEFLYRNPKELKKLTRNAWPYARTRFTPDNAKVITDNY